jgi:hypothetical protein
MATKNTLTLINTVTVGAGGAATIEFTSIPQTYTDLLIKTSYRGTSAHIAYDTNISFNGSGANFTGKLIYGSGSAANSPSIGNSPGLYVGANATANTFSNGEYYIPNYTSSNYKSFSVDEVSENNASTAYIYMSGMLWSQSAAITSITLTPASGTFVQYSTAYLYGVKSVATSAKATGGLITQDDTYFYHTFLSSGVFTPTQSLTADYLVVAGGGGGGGTASDAAGGGGAGGLRCTVTATGGGGALESALSLNSGTAYTVTIGAGGAGGAASDTSAGTGTVGSNSVFSTITSNGGGGGGGHDYAGGSGGSGGGNGSKQSGSGGVGTANQGFAGGSTGDVNNSQGGGGGGAGAVGTNGADISTSGVAGGIGVATSINGSSTYYAGGGGGGPSNGGGSRAIAGLGGLGGGGGGGTNNAAGTAGTANTGGGGGASNRVAGGSASGGGAGGSGIVIVRYAK